MPYCLLNILKGEQMEGCSHGFYTAAWTYCVKTLRSVVLGPGGRDGHSHFHSNPHRSARERDPIITPSPLLLFLLFPLSPFRVKVRDRRLQAVGKAGL